MKGNLAQRNREKIKNLRSKQKHKKLLIELYKQNAKKRLFIFSLVIVVITLAYLEDSYKVFGSLENFLITSLSVLLSVIIIYYAIVFFLIRLRKKEIKRINVSIYSLMKLRNLNE